MCGGTCRTAAVFGALYRKQREMTGGMKGRELEGQDVLNGLVGKVETRRALTTPKHLPPQLLTVVYYS